jgi:hypothetical protein
MRWWCGDGRAEPASESEEAHPSCFGPAHLLQAGVWNLHRMAPETDSDRSLALAAASGHASAGESGATSRIGPNLKRALFAIYGGGTAAPALQNTRAPASYCVLAMGGHWTRIRLGQPSTPRPGPGPGPGVNPSRFNIFQSIVSIDFDIFQHQVSTYLNYFNAFTELNTSKKG